MPSYESSMRNLEKARERGVRPGLAQQSGIPDDPAIRIPVAHLPRHKALWSCLGTELGVSHTWLQKLVRRFQADPSKMWRLQVAKVIPNSGTQSRAGIQSTDERAWGVAFVRRRFSRHFMKKF